MALHGMACDMNSRQTNDGRYIYIYKLINATIAIPTEIRLLRAGRPSRCSDVKYTVALAVAGNHPTASLYWFKVTRQARKMRLSSKARSLLSHTPLATHISNLGLH